MKHEQKLLSPAWTRRWFELEGPELKYYSSKSSSTPSKRIDLLSIESIHPFDHGDHGVFSFILKTPERNYFLRAESEGDMKRWVRGLREQQDLWKKQSNTIPRGSPKLKVRHYKDEKSLPRPVSREKTKRFDDDGPVSHKKQARFSHK
jgi:hypothetical protein